MREGKRILPQFKRWRVIIERSHGWGGMENNCWLGNERGKKTLIFFDSYCWGALEQGTYTGLHLNMNNCIKHKAGRVSTTKPHMKAKVYGDITLSLYSLYVWFFTIHHISCRTSVCFPLSSITVIMKNQPLLHNDTVVWFSLQRHIVLTHISALRAFKQTNRINYSRLNTTVSDVQVLRVWRRIQSQDYYYVPVFLEHLKICVTKQHNITLSGEKCMEAKTA